ncbi:hypothetical protein BH18ACT3_BH18ACT3_16380 [soil metagenome]
MARSSSTNRAAKLAQRSGRARVRFQGGTLFPAIVAMVAVLGLATIVYARQSRPAEDSSPPTVDDHWHASYGLYLCNPESGEMEWQQLTGAKEEEDTAGQLVSDEFLATGVHSHDDGVIHWHAFTSRATGRNADLGVFLDVYGVDLSDSELRFPDDQLSGATYKEDDTKCGDQDGSLRVQAWDSYQNTGEGITYTANFNDIRMTKNSMVYTIAFAADDVVLPMPPEAQNLPALGAADSGGTEDPAAATTGSSAPASTAPGSTAPVSTAPASSAPPGTTGATTQPSG